MDKKMFDPEDLNVIKAKIDLYKATIESLKAEHQAYQELLFQHDDQQQKEEVTNVNENHYEEEYTEDEASEVYDYFAEQFDYLHESLNELSQEMLSVNEKIDLILIKQDQLMENDELKELKEEIANLKKSMQPKATPAPPVDQTPKGFSQLKNMVRSNSQVHDPNEQNRFQGPSNYSSSPRNHSSKPPQGLPRGHKPLSSGKKNKTAKSNKMNTPKKRDTPAPKPPKSEGHNIKRNDEPDANMQLPNMEANQPPLEQLNPVVEQIPEEAVTEHVVQEEKTDEHNYPEKDEPKGTKKELHSKEDSIIEEKPEEQNNEKETRQDENKYEDSIEETPKNEKTEKKQPVNAFFSLFQRG